jgi:segregation and condensation protein A
VKYRIRVPVYEGPLDLLLYLIKKEELKICDIEISKITDQYLGYLETMKLLDLDIAGDFLVMAATLMHIKSKELLPKEEVPEEDEEDSKEDLMRRLMEYQRFKEVAGFLGDRESERIHAFTRHQGEATEAPDTEFIEANIFDLISVFSKVLIHVPEELRPELAQEAYTVEEKIGSILELMRDQSQVLFTALFESMHNRSEVIATFLAILELIRIKEVIVRQTVAFGEIYVVRVEKP